MAYLFADDCELVVLELLQALLDIDITNNTRRVDHARAEEPAYFMLDRRVIRTCASHVPLIEVITTYKR